MIFRTSTQIIVGIPTTYTIHEDTPPTSKPPTQRIWSCFLSCHPQQLCVIFVGEHPRSVYFRNQVYFLLIVPLSSSMQPMQLTRNFHRSIGVPFTLGNRCISCYAIHVIYMTCQRDRRVNIQQTLQNISQYSHRFQESFPRTPGYYACHSHVKSLQILFIYPTMSKY